MVIRAIDQEACTACGICELVCPNDVIRPDGAGRPYVAFVEDCTACRLCEDRCSLGAITVQLGAARKASEVYAFRQYLIGLGIDVRLSKEDPEEPEGI